VQDMQRCQCLTRHFVRDILQQEIQPLRQGANRSGFREPGRHCRRDRGGQQFHVPFRTLKHRFS
jgi:hypothetical protein